MMNAMEVTDEERAMIEEARAEKADGWKPFLEEDYTASEKCEAFDRLHAMALREFEARTSDDGQGGKNIKQYVFEAVMELLGKDVWDVLNASV